MLTYILLGKYTAESLKGAGSERTQKAYGLIEQYGGIITSIYALLGGYDLVILVSFPGTQDAIKASVALSKLTNISFSTLPAIPIEQFDKILSAVV